MSFSYTFFILFLFYEVSSSGQLLANKCCPVGQLLDEYWEQCVPDVEAIAEEIDSQICQSRVCKFPLWLDNTTIIYDSKTKNPVRGNYSFLHNAPEDAIVNFGHWPCELKQMKSIHSKRRNAYKLFTNGSLQITVRRTNFNTTEEDQLMLTPEEWCSDRYVDDSTPQFVFLACPCDHITCVNSCCYGGDVLEVKSNFKETKGKCIQLSEDIEFFPTFYEGRCPVAGSALSAPSNSDPIKAYNGVCSNISHEDVIYTVLEGHLPSCNAVYRETYLNKMPPSKEAPLRMWLQRNGSVLTEHYGYFHRHNSCVQLALIEGEQVDSAIFCTRETCNMRIKGYNIFYSVLFVVGGIFLLLTLVVHLAVPYLRRKESGKALICHCATLLLASVFLTVGHLKSCFMPYFCFISGYIVQFAFLTSFFWLNVICFDVTWMFCSMRRSIQGTMSMTLRKDVFLHYSLYAWSCPTIIVAITLFMDLAPENIVDPKSPWRPDVGQVLCSFRTPFTTWVYYYGPIGLLLLANLMMYVMTVCRLHIDKQTTGKYLRRLAARPPPECENLNKGSNGETKSRGNARKAKRKEWKMYSKLFLMVGLTWLTEVIAFSYSDEKLVYFYYVMDAVNFLRSAVIFALVGCQHQAVNPLRARLRSLVGPCCGCMWGGRRESVSVAVDMPTLNTRISSSTTTTTKSRGSSRDS